MQPTKVLLCSMPDEFLGFHVAARLPNLGLVSIAGNREPTESDIGVVDLVLIRDRLYPHLKRILDKFQPDFVGLSCMTFQYYTARRIAKWIKEEYDSQIKILMGGYHPTLCFEEVMQSPTNFLNQDDALNSNAAPWVDYIIRGEGEDTLRNFIHAYRNNDPLSQVSGLSWRSPDGSIHHNECADILDLETLNFPDRSARLINSGYHMIGKQGDVVETSRGCTNACKFCSITKMYGRNIRFYKLDRVIQDIQNCVDRGSRAILFIDDNITMNPARFEELCDKIIEKHWVGISFHTQASAAGLLARPNLVPKMGKAGFSVVFFGIENINPRNLAFFKKSIPLKHLKSLVTQLNSNNMISFGGFILGNPYDGLPDFDMNVKFARYLDLDVPAFEIMTPYPKTETREELLEQGLLTNPTDYSRYNGIYANVKTQYLSPQELEHKVLECYYHYYTPRYLLSRLKRFNLINDNLLFILQIIKRYGPLALSSWMKSFMAKLRGVDPEKADGMVVDYFKDKRDGYREKYSPPSSKI